MASGSHGTAVVQKDMADINPGCCPGTPCCEGCCAQLGRWVGTTGHTAMSDRFIQLAVEGAFVQGCEGSWGQNQKMTVQINVPAAIPMEQMQAWASALQAASPKIMKPPDMEGRVHEEPATQVLPSPKNNMAAEVAGAVPTALASARP